MSRNKCDKKCFFFFFKTIIDERNRDKKENVEHDFLLSTPVWL